MGRIIVNNNVTLDGVMQAPARPDEDERGGFTHGGWAIPYTDAVMMEQAAKGGATSGALLLGRRTYEDFFAVWPKRTDNPFTAVLTNTQKYVASTTLKEPLPWANSTLLAGDAADAVAELRRQPGKDIVILGSGALIHSLARRNLIDEYRLLIHPLILGSGRRLFPDGAAPATLRLISTITTTTGVVIATYQPAE
ncbi:MAG TPA: dihydrofolate reductase family protein [Ktedonobacterales bacterium]|nr:dihydrofolate reductase family protein [Ktedonobacterales bacterium]